MRKWMGHVQSWKSWGWWMAWWKVLDILELGMGWNRWSSIRNRWWLKARDWYAVGTLFTPADIFKDLVWLTRNLFSRNQLDNCLSHHDTGSRFAAISVHTCTAKTWLMDGELFSLLASRTRWAIIRKLFHSPPTLSKRNGDSWLMAAVPTIIKLFDLQTRKSASC